MFQQMQAMAQKQVHKSFISFLFPPEKRRSAPSKRFARGGSSFFGPISILFFVFIFAFALTFRTSKFVSQKTKKGCNVFSFVKCRKRALRSFTEFYFSIQNSFRERTEGGGARRPKKKVCVCVLVRFGKAAFSFKTNAFFRSVFVLKDVVMTWLSDVVVCCAGAAGGQRDFKNVAVTTGIGALALQQYRTCSTRH